MKRYVVLISVVAALGGLLFGFDTAVIAGALFTLKDYFHLGDASIGLLVASSSIGCIPGAFFAGRMADRSGRKNMMIITAILYGIAALGSGIAGSFALFNLQQPLALYAGRGPGSIAAVSPIAFFRA